MGVVMSEQGAPSGLRRGPGRRRQPVEPTRDVASTPQEDLRPESPTTDLDDFIAELSGWVSALEEAEGTHISGDFRRVLLRLRVHGAHFLSEFSSHLLEEWNAATRTPSESDAEIEQTWGDISRRQVLAELKDRLSLLEAAKELAAAKDRHRRAPSQSDMTGKMQDKKLVFIVYGRNTEAYNALVLFLRSLGLKTRSFNEIAAELGGSPYIGHVVRHGMKQAAAVVVLFTPDEVASLKKDKKFARKEDKKDDKGGEQPRPNVIFEAGYAMALDPEHTILVRMGGVRLFSDLSGVHFVELDNSNEARKHFRAKLAGVGCEIDKDTNDWANVGIAGNFEQHVQQPARRASRKAVASRRKR